MVLSHAMSYMISISTTICVNSYVISTSTIDHECDFYLHLCLLYVISTSTGNCNCHFYLQLCCFLRPLRLNWQLQISFLPLPVLFPTSSQSLPAIAGMSFLPPPVSTPTSFPTPSASACRVSSQVFERTSIWTSNPKSSDLKIWSHIACSQHSYFFS